MVDEQLIGVSVIETNDYHFLRFHLRKPHIEHLAKPRAVIRGQPANGFIIAPADNEGLKINPKALDKGYIYLQTALSHFDLSRRLRRRIDIRPQFENGHIRVPPLPQAWIDVSPEFDASTTIAYGETNTERKLGHHPTDDALRIGSTVAPLNGHTDANGHAVTVPPPKQGLQNYMVPDNMRDMQAALSVKLDEARAILRAMEERTGMKFVLDRNMRVVVSLPQL